MSFLSKVEKLVKEEMQTEWSTVDMNISDDVFLQVATMAHEKDITFNQMVVHILEEQLREAEDGEDNS